MEMEAKTVTQDNVTILEISGPININTSIDVETHINDIIEGGSENTKLLIDLKDTTFVSSSGLRVFLSTSKKMKSKKFEFAICSLNKTVQEVFSISGFSTLIKVGKTRNEAIQFFNSEPN